MEFMIDKECFKNAVFDVSKVISSKSLFPILSGIKIIADNEGLTLIGSNADVIVKRFIPLTIDGEKIVKIYSTGSIVVSAKYLSELVKKLPSEIHLKVTGEFSVRIRSDGIIIDLNGFSAEEYPDPPEVVFDHNTVRIAGVKLIESIKQTIFSVAKSETQPVLAGMCMSFDNNKLICSATDSHRMALREMTIESDLNGSVIVPSTSLHELTKLIGTGDNMIDIAFTSNYILFGTKEMRFYSKLIEGRYPDITALKSRETKSVLILNTNQFLQGVDRACLFIEEWKDNNVFIKVVDNSKISISSSGSEIGRIEEVQDCKEISGNMEVSLSLNGKYLVDALKVIKTKEIKLSLGATMEPIYLEPLGDTSNYYLISQVRTR